MSDALDEAVKAQIKILRDANRPTMEAVVAVMDGVFRDTFADARVLCIQAGPTTWVWRDETMSARGLDKFYVLTESAMPDCPGYPLLTIRQAYSTRLDSWVTASGLITGPDEGSIMQAVSLMVGNHLAAYSGYRYAMNATIASGGNPRAGLAAGKAIMEAAEGRFVVGSSRDDDDDDSVEQGSDVN